MADSRASRRRLRRRRGGGWVGLDLGRESIKLVHLVSDSGRLRPQAVGRTATPDGWFTGALELVALEPLVDTLAMLCDELGVPCCEAACALGPPALVLEPVQVNPELESTVEELAFEAVAGRIERERAAIEWSLGADGRGLVAAAERQRVDELCLALEAAALVPAQIDAQPLAWLEGLRPGGQALIGDLGAGGTTWIWSSDGQYVESRYVPVGGQALRGAAAQAQGVAAEVAEAGLRAGCTGQPGDEFGEVLDRWLDEILAPVTDHGGLESLDDVLLAGGGALLPGLAEACSARLGRWVSLAQPWFALAPEAADELPPEVRDEAACYGASLGLALALAER